MKPRELPALYGAFVAVMFLLTVGCAQPMASQPGAAPMYANSNWPMTTTAGAGAPYGSNGQIAQVPTANPGQLNELSQQVSMLNSRLTQFNSDNDNLHAQVAALQQRLQNANSYNEQLKQQMSDQLAQVQQIQLQNQQLTARQQLAATQQNVGLQYGGQSGGSSGNGIPGQFANATIRANNGLMNKLDTVQLPGFKSWMDGDVIRIEGPTDRLFVSGTYQLNPNDSIVLGNLAGAIRQHFPRQVIGVEAHWDGSPIQPATTSHHQLTATQALAVFDLLVKSGLSHDQVFTMAVGSNRPRYPQGVDQSGASPNRRIEIVIYPETFN